MDNSKSFSKDTYLTDPKSPDKEQAPVDPSNTSHIGQKIETGVVSRKEGISEQSAEWEDIQERGIPRQDISNKAEKYIKKPSPEEMNHEDALDEADEQSDNKQL